MKKIKREILSNSNSIQFKKKNKYTATLYYVPSKLNIDKRYFCIHINGASKKLIDNLKVTAIYYDVTSKFSKHEILESTDDIFISKSSVDGVYNHSEKILIASGNLLLWKLVFQSSIAEESELFFDADND